MKSFQLIEKKLFERGFQLIAGTDEAGRGPLAGPVVAAAVIFPPDVIIEGIEDSKKINAKEREKLAKEIQTKAIAYSISVIDHNLIDELNIFRASLLAIKQAIERLKVTPDFILVDGKFSPDISIPVKSIVKGDSKCFTIASASILAKTYRDSLMREYSKEYPKYNFQKNMGYPTLDHIQAILKFGHCEIHRKTFLKKIYERRFKQLKIEF